MEELFRRNNVATGDTASKVSDSIMWWPRIENRVRSTRMNWKFACAKWEVGFTSFPEVKQLSCLVELDRNSLSEVANHTELIMCAQRLTSWSSIRGGGVRVTLELPFFIFQHLQKRSMTRQRNEVTPRSKSVQLQPEPRSEKSSFNALRPTATFQNGYGRGCCVWSTGSASCHGWAWAPFQRRPPSSAAWAWSGRFRSCPCSPCSYGRLAPADRKKWAKCAGDAIVGSPSAHLHGWALRPPDTAVSTDRRCQCQFHQHRVTWLTQRSSATNYTTQGLII